MLLRPSCLRADLAELSCRDLFPVLLGAGWVSQKRDFLSWGPIYKMLCVQLFELFEALLLVSESLDCTVLVLPALAICMWQ